MTVHESIGFETMERWVRKWKKMLDRAFGSDLPLYLVYEHHRDYRVHLHGLSVFDESWSAVDWPFKMKIPKYRLEKMTPDMQKILLKARYRLHTPEFMAMYFWEAITGSFCRVEKIKRHVDVVEYCTKYILKEFEGLSEEWLLIDNCRDTHVFRSREDFGGLF